MNIALIYAKYGNIENQPNIECVSENYGVFPPLNIAQVAAIIEKTGHRCIIIDGNAKNMSKKEILSEIKKFNADMLGFTITTYLFHETLDIIRFLKAATKLPILIGGMHLSLYPKETFSYKEFDYGIIGECEKTLPKLLDAIEKGKPLKNINNIIFRKSGDIMITKKEEHSIDLDSIPFPSRHLLKNELYFSFISQRKNFTAMITSRGCPYRCIFCEQGSKRFRGRTAKNIVDEMEECQKKHAIREIDIFDSSFTIDKKRVIDVCDEYKKRNLKVKWSIRTRVDLMDDELLKALASSGCIRIYYGIESGNENILKTIGKSTDLRQIKYIIKKTKRYGIATFGYFMIGNPGETCKTIKQTIEFAKSLNLDYAQFSKVSTLPGTELYELWKKEFKEDYWKTYILDKKKKRIMQRYACALTEHQVDHWVKKAYRQFYFRPSYIISALFRIRSFDELIRSAKAALKMVIN